jgi:hypothetical protein
MTECPNESIFFLPAAPLIKYALDKRKEERQRLVSKNILANKKQTALLIIDKK